MTPVVFKKPIKVCLAHYLLLLPFLPGFFALQEYYSAADLRVYIGGLLLMAVLIMYDNHKPAVKIESLRIYLPGRHMAKSLSFEKISSYRRISSNRIRIFFRAHQTVNLYLGESDLEKFIKILQDKQIQPIK